ncbi:hypothetical protein B296_00012352 [Ensete ventricosum]|uniref:Uncharacterized protein n=1 Tax=Ensete ventricosum TaxID=4639 RepID=A0A427A395_ENSVE|nr:hypothetical protein B296_00012352 [Ensete ventricosum]
MRRPKRRLLPLRRVQITNARLCLSHARAPIDIRGPVSPLIIIKSGPLPSPPLPSLPSPGWLANLLLANVFLYFFPTFASYPLGATSHVIRQNIRPRRELRWVPDLSPIAMVVYLVGGGKQNNNNNNNNYVGFVPVNQFRRDTARPFLDFKDVSWYPSQPRNRKRMAETRFLLLSPPFHGRFPSFRSSHRHETETVEEKFPLSSLSPCAMLATSIALKNP